ncbi:hypothetical protein [Micromonospora sp. NPDC005367]|uniref:hypothetical protein n=1 Tax=Micromonospora sp. NPDC005367 TaxID=3155590 RepID=UPI0033B4EDD1
MKRGGDGRDYNLCWALSAASRQQLVHTDPPAPVEPPWLPHAEARPDSPRARHDSAASRRRTLTSDVGRLGCTVSSMTAVENGNAGHFRDPKYRLGGLAAGAILVRCPRCAGQAWVLRDPDSADDSRHHFWLRRRLSCLECAFTDVWNAPRRPGDNARTLPDFSGPNDPYFQLPLWLSVDCRGRVLWAYNAEHLDLLDAYVSARLRERGRDMGGQTLVERLPAWMKDGRHRADVLDGIGRLRALLP